MITKQLSAIRLFAIILALMFALGLSGQIPDKMSYQAVLRDASGALVSGSYAGIKISILQSSPNGVEVYSELHTPLSNANGLVSLEIGGGISVSGDYSSVDWSRGPYYIKTETDPGGGSNYTIIAISPLLSVPYSNIAGGIVYTNEFNRQYTLRINELGQAVFVYLSPDTLVSISFNTNTLYIFPHDNSDSIAWQNGVSMNVNAIHGNNGAINTDSIVTYQGIGAYAAYLCDTLTAFGYNDWYLPSKDELDSIYQKRGIIGGFYPALYWSSTAHSNGNEIARIMDFSTGIKRGHSTIEMCRLRCIRRD